MAAGAGAAAIGIAVLAPSGSSGGGGRGAASGGILGAARVCLLTGPAAAAGLWSVAVSRVFLTGWLQTADATGWGWDKSSGGGERKPWWAAAAVGLSWSAQVGLIIIGLRSEPGAAAVIVALSPALTLGVRLARGEEKLGLRPAVGIVLAGLALFLTSSSGRLF